MEYNPNPAASPFSAHSPVEQHKKDAVTAMVLGIVGLALVWYGVFTIGTLILSIIALARSRKNREFAQSIGIAEAGQNKAGFICGLIGLILSVAFLFALIVACVVIFIFLPGILSGIPGFMESIQYACNLFGSSLIGL